MPTLRRVLLVRHCLSSGPEPEAPLTMLGYQQAATLATHLSQFGIDHVIASPFRRALQTIEPFAQLVQLPIHVDARLVERRLSAHPVEDWLQHTAGPSKTVTIRPLEVNRVMRPSVVDVPRSKPFSPKTMSCQSWSPTAIS